MATTLRAPPGASRRSARPRVRRPAEVLDLPLPLGAGGTQSARVHAALRDAILRGRLAAGLRLPSSRALAAQLGLRRNAVVLAYEHLLSDGLAEARTGAGTFVAALLPQPPEPAATARAATACTGNRTAPPQPRAVPGRAAPAGPHAATDLIVGRAATPEPPGPANPGPFALGHTSPDPLILAQFGRLLRAQLLRADPMHFGYGDPRGSESLRAAVAEHLAVTRGIRCDAAQVMLTSGTQQGLRLVAETLLRPGDTAWIEDPGYPTAWRVLRAVGASLVPVPVDGAGLVVEAGLASAPKARLAYVTPSHQFPTGVTMTMARRAALLDWAREHDAWVVEDDYDSEFRYAGPPLTALAGLGGAERVIYLGTFSKTLFPGLRVGYAVLPPALLHPVMAARAVADRFPSTLLGEALAELMRSGAFSAHLRRMRNRYRAARDLLAALLDAGSGGRLRVVVPDQGLHLLAMLPPDWPPGAGAAILAAAGMEARLLSESRLTPGAQDGFVLGFSGQPVPVLRNAAEQLAASVRRFVPGAGGPPDGG
ncbi:MocR-like pyridoxine biosynthesis transcription factor PdxR [Roseomonas elaeocarpi]|uniref:PLP-dependent aminotransferase family protein n=1 Tax=Roseomonas elaeocarpi TaxID=907779 RepID=A0ABV6JRN2_9PROT